MANEASRSAPGYPIYHRNLARGERTSPPGLAISFDLSCW